METDQVPETEQPSRQPIRASYSLELHVRGPEHIDPPTVQAVVDEVLRALTSGAPVSRANMPLLTWTGSGERSDK